ncbi:hypothetical protein AIOL_002508 [Candidatus Rhodobacter oscarellae]|uniref:Uncharacterized protein n=1 Tax=Candidatus Rhodobacter oscarellae TaxID=1675527 RepID=A0A0J9GVE4_9RHOB|nr:hypothetical protein [Candidatus Rhodobacter lobularis]KMW57543.1 hypothetical protein AIOL_002508 [Candidatus Rhodobacter lobularis]
MVDAVWLHIGTPKSGTSSLQNHMLKNRAHLAAQGLAYLSPNGKGSSNDLAIAINKARPEIKTLAEELNRQIEEAPQRVGLISSEMFYGIKPETLTGLMPALAERPLTVLVYLRRQDRFIEAMYLQKSKNGRFRGSIAEYIAKFQGSGSDYAAMLADWAAHEAPLVPRVLEPARLAGGTVVTDALLQMGIDEPGEMQRDLNLSPGYHRVQLLQAAASVEVADPRRLQRRLAARYPQSPEERSPVLTPQERIEYVAKYADGNAALAQQFFSGQEDLFDRSDLESPADETGIPAYTDAQLREISRLLEIIKELR